MRTYVCVCIHVRINMHMCMYVCICMYGSCTKKDTYSQAHIYLRSYRSIDNFYTCVFFLSGKYFFQFEDTGLNAKTIIKAEPVVEVAQAGL